jgi:Nucleoside diphosphate kinase
VVTVHSRPELQRVAGGAHAALLASSTIALCSPLCVASGRVPRAAEWLVTAGFEVRHVRSLRLRREHVEGLWAHLIPHLPRRRVDVVTEALTAGPSALVGLRYPAGEVSAAEHLSELKGSADPARRHERSLRSHLGAPNLLTSLVHTPDDPDELLRELEVLLPDRDEREAFWLAQWNGPALDKNSLPPFAFGANPTPPIDAFVVAQRIQARLLADDAATSRRGDTYRRAREQLAAVMTGDPFDLDVLTAGIDVTVWERIVLASECAAPSPRRPTEVCHP